MFTFLHLVSNYNAVTSLVMNRLNRRRATVLVRHFLSNGTVPTLKEGNRAEGVFNRKFPVETPILYKVEAVWGMYFHSVSFSPTTCFSRPGLCTVQGDTGNIRIGVPLVSVCQT